MRKREEERTPVIIETRPHSDRGPIVRFRHRFAGRRSRCSAHRCSSGQRNWTSQRKAHTTLIEGCGVYEGERLVRTVYRLVRSPKANPYIEIEPAAGEKLLLVPFISQAILSGRRWRTGIELGRLSRFEDRCLHPFPEWFNWFFDQRQSPMRCRPAALERGS
jgi:hypothetical protein